MMSEGVRPRMRYSRLTKALTSRVAISGILARICRVSPQLMTFPVRAKPLLCGRASIQGTVVKLL
jgi:hypothetical protein